MRSGKFSERGTALNLIAAGEMLGADPTSTYHENILNGWKEAWTPENIVTSLLLGIAVIEAPLSGMVRKVGGNAVEVGVQYFKSLGAAAKGFSKLKCIILLNQLVKAGKLPNTISQFDKGKIFRRIRPSSF